MNKLLEQAIAFLEDNPTVTEIELSDGTNRVRIVRAIPFPDNINTRVPDASTYSATLGYR